MAQFVIFRHSNDLALHLHMNFVGSFAILVLNSLIPDFAISWYCCLPSFGCCSLWPERVFFFFFCFYFVYCIQTTDRECVFIPPSLLLRFNLCTKIVWHSLPFVFLQYFIKIRISSWLPFLFWIWFHITKLLVYILLQFFHLCSVDGNFITIPLHFRGLYT